MKKQILISVFLLLFLYNGVSQDSIPVHGEIEKAAVDISEVEVVAYQTPGRLKSLAGSVSVVRITKAQSGDINILPSLRGTPGLFVQEGTAGTVKLTLRGIGSRYPYGTKKIKMFFDDIPLYSAEGETTFDDVNPEFLSRIEILRGPTSSIYGASLGGTVILYPGMIVNNQSEIKLRGTVGSFGYQNHSLSYSAATVKNNLFVSYSGISSDGFRQNNRYKRNSFFIHYKHKFNEKVSNSFLVTGSDIESQIPSSVDSVTFFNTPENAASTWLKTKGYEHPKRVLGGYKLSYTPAKNWNFLASIFGTWHQTEENRPFNFLKESGFSYGSRLLAIYSSENNGISYRWVTGANLFLESYQSSIVENIGGNGVMGSLQQKGKQSIYQTDFFTQGEVKFQRFTFTAGMNGNLSGFRFTDQFSMDSLDQTGFYHFTPNLSPRLSIAWNPVSDVFVYSSVNHGFSVPSLSETLSPLGLVNRDIKPEKALSFEAGIRFHLFRSYTYVDFASYYMMVSDLIVPKRISEDVYVGMNAGSSLHRGVEIDLHQKIFERNLNMKIVSISAHLTGSINRYTFRDFVDNATDYSGRHLPGMPEKSFSGKLETKYHGFYCNFEMNQVDKIPLNDANSRYTDSYEIMNVKAGYEQSFAKKWVVNGLVSINNLTNKQYASMVVVNAPGTSARPSRYYYPAFPRWVTITVIITSIRPLMRSAG